MPAGRPGSATGDPRGTGTLTAFRALRYDPSAPAGVAQQAERPPCKRQVSGSNPLTGSIDLQVRDVFLASGGSRTRGHGTSDPFHERDISQAAAAAAAADRFVDRVSAKPQRRKCYLAIACGIVASSGLPVACLRASSPECGCC